MGFLIQNVANNWIRVMFHKHFSFSAVLHFVLIIVYVWIAKMLAPICCCCCCPFHLGNTIKLQLTASFYSGCWVVIRNEKKKILSLPMELILMQRTNIYTSNPVTMHDDTRSTVYMRQWYMRDEQKYANKMYFMWFWHKIQQIFNDAP